MSRCNGPVHLLVRLVTEHEAQTADTLAHAHGRLLHVGVRTHDRPFSFFYKRRGRLNGYWTVCALCCWLSASRARWCPMSSAAELNCGFFFLQSPCPQMIACRALRHEGTKKQVLKKAARRPWARKIASSTDGLRIGRRARRRSHGAWHSGMLLCTWKAAVLWCNGQHSGL